MITNKEMEEVLWEAKMLGHYVPCEGQSLSDEYHRYMVESITDYLKARSNE